MARKRMARHLPTFSRFGRALRASLPGTGGWGGPKFIGALNRRRDALCALEQLHAIVRLNAPLSEGMRQCAETQRRDRSRWPRLIAVTVFITLLAILFSEDLFRMIGIADPMVGAGVSGLILRWAAAAGMAFAAIALYVRAMIGASLRRAALFTALAERLEQGHALSECFASLPRVFPAFVAGLARAGEESGRLEEALERSVRALNRLGESRRVARNLAGYLGGVSIGVLLLGALLTTRILPIFVEILNEFGAKPPVETRILMEMRDFVIFRMLTPPPTTGGIAGGVIQALIGAALAAGLAASVKTRWPVRALSRIAAKLPYFRGARAEGISGTVCAALAPLQAAGAPLPQALSLAADLLEDRAARAAMARVRAAVEQGVPLSAALREQGGACFAQSMVEMTALGEQSRMLPESLDFLAEHYAARTHARKLALVQALGPACVLALGAIVLFLQLGAFGPLLELTNAFVESM